jgi:pimeloyl-ACP methyl ester carboxylesterase
MTHVLNVLGLLLLAYGGLCLFVFLIQRKLIYMPSVRASVPPADFVDWVGTKAAGGAEFWGYQRTNGHGACLVFFHGNGGNAGGWAHAVEEFPGDVFVLEYPGYGQRPGRPTEATVKAAALAGFEAVAPNYRQVVLAGQSLGSAVTEAVLKKHPEKVSALVLVAPFTSLADVAAAHYAFLPARFLVRDRYLLLDAYLGFPGRSLVVTAAADEIIPRAQSLKFLAATNASRRVVELEASHNSIDLDREFWTKVLNGAHWQQAGADVQSITPTIEAVR